ncbi:sugar transporter [Bradyrhizobium ganzhouense]|uniref:sugar transporter n=1 Tax=Bradyrhizobium ganzhouense TaxID=1179767 RepID=UPI003CECDE8D
MNLEADSFEEGDRSHLLRPGFYWEVAKRRWLYFLLPFVLIAFAGAAAVYLWPAIYLAEGKILVQSQQIPTELVRPTVTSAAQERIEVIQQRTMTRDNLVAIADKFRLFQDKRDLMSATELVEAVKKATKIAPVDPTLDFRQRTLNQNPTIVFSVGFEYGDPQTAAQVANELVTRILNEDLRDRTSRANDTTKFLAKEVERLQAENAALDERIARLKVSESKLPAGTPDRPTALGQLKAELAQKSALYSPRHPTIQALTKQIQALEQTEVAALATKSDREKNDGTVAATLEALTAQQESLQKNLETATSKLAAARLGESLEKDQRSEKLEVIEQPTVPQRPVRPNRAKLAALSMLAAAAAGLGLAFLAEIADKSIRRSSDLFALLDPRVIVSIPYIETASELKRRRRRIVGVLVLVVACAIGAVVAGYLLLPIDLMIARARVGLFR